MVLRSVDERLAKSLFLEALELEPQRRSAFLDRKCPSETPVRARVERLFRAHREAHGFLEDDRSSSEHAHVGRHDRHSR